MFLYLSPSPPLSLKINNISQINAHPHLTLPLEHLSITVDGPQEAPCTPLLLVLQETSRIHPSYWLLSHHLPPLPDSFPTVAH